MLSDFLIRDGVLTGYTGPGGHVSIPDSVTEIGAEAFARCNTLRQVTIPASVHSIGHCAFFGCDALERVDILGRPAISFNAFEFCAGLTDFAAPNVPANDIVSPFVKSCAALSFLANPFPYLPAGTYDGYRDIVLSNRRRLLPRLLERDLDFGLRLYAQDGQITTHNLEQEFLEPALAAKSIRCVAFLLDLGRPSPVQTLEE